MIRDESRDEYRRVIRRLVDDGAEGVIYGCTEIELLVGPEDSPVPTFPTTRLHVEAAVERALAGDRRTTSRPALATPSRAWSVYVRRWKRTPPSGVFWTR